MDKQILKQEKGSITVFLSLILLLILSLILTLIEGARVNTARVYAERSFSTAMDSVLAEFYGPLMKEYHLLGLDTGYGSGTVQEEELLTRLNQYMSYTFEPNQGLNSGRLELYDISVEDLALQERTMLMDCQGELFLNEVVEYEKYRELGNGMELLLDKMTLLEEPKKVSVIYEEKAKVEEELVVIDEGILALMRLLDGISTSKKGLKTKKDGTMATIPYYVKKICYGERTKERTGINNDNIFSALKNNYVDPSEAFAVVKDSVNTIEVSKERIKELKVQKEDLQEQLDTAESDADDIKQSLKKEENTEAVKEIKSQLEEYQDEVNSLQSELSELQNQIDEYEIKKNTAINQIGVIMDRLNMLIVELKPLITEAEMTIDQIMETSKKADPKIKQYEENLHKQKDKLSVEMYESLEDDLKELKRYQTGETTGYNFPRMKEILESNALVLISSEASLFEGEEAFYAEDYQRVQECFESAQKAMAGYQIEGLKIDYSTLVIHKESKADPLDLIETLIEDGLTGLVMDPELISKAELTGDTLPSVIAAVSGENNTGYDITSLFKDMVIGEKNSGIGNMFGSFDDFSTDTLLEEGMNRAVEHLLFQAYLQEHFYRFPYEGETLNTRKPSSLSYEQEYLLMGKTTDKANLEPIILRIIFLRTILNFTTLLKDKEKWNEAKTIAVSLVGFSGLPVLVSITQMIIMVLLAFSEALVDTCALLMGKEIPLIKNKVTLTFSELFQLNRTFIKAKASAVTALKNGSSFGYSDYLKLFLFFKNKITVSYRSMDLIQENIKLRYESNFSFLNCLFGLEVKAKFYIAPKFSAFSYLQRYISGGSGYYHSSLAGYSY